MPSHNYDIWLDEVKKINGKIRKLPRVMNPCDLERLHRLQLKRQWYSNLIKSEEEEENKK